MNPVRKKAEELIKLMEEIIFNYEGDLSSNKTCIECALIAVKQVQQFGNTVGIREPMMFWNSVESELKKMKDE